MATPAGVDFDRNRLNTGELIAGIAGVVLLVDLWFDWYGVSVSAAGGLLKGFSIGVSATAWEAFSVIDIILFLVALIAIAIAVLKATNRLPEIGVPASTILTIAGGLALLLILYRTIDTPVDTHGVQGIDVSRKLGLWLGLLSAAALTYGGWRAMQEEGTSFSDLGAGARGGGGTGTGAAAPTTPMPATGADTPGVPGGGAAGVSPGKEGPGAPHPGTSTGAPGESADEAPPAASATADPVPGATAGESPPGLAGEPPASGGTEPPGL
jgi:hypothetical protein